MAAQEDSEGRPNGSFVLTDHDGWPTVSIDRRAALLDAQALVREVMADPFDRSRVARGAETVHKDHGPAAGFILSLALVAAVNPVTAALVNRLEMAGVGVDEIAALVTGAINSVGSVQGVEVPDGGRKN